MKQNPSQDDLLRLEQAVRALVEQSRRLRDENHALRSQLQQREQRIHHLDEKLLEANQVRQDAVKRLDDVITQVDQIDARLGAGRD